MGFAAVGGFVVVNLNDFIAFPIGISGRFGGVLFGVSSARWEKILNSSLPFASFSPICHEPKRSFI
jgi:hypothetical protein